MSITQQAALTAIATLIASAGAWAQTPACTNAEANRQLVIHFYDQFFNQHQTEAAAKTVSADYKQHNPQVPDGKAPFVAYFTDFFKKNPQASSRIVRSAVDCDLVWLHNQSRSGPDDRGRAIVNIFRVKDGQIVEHWDVIQPVPEHAANDNTMF